MVGWTQKVHENVGIASRAHAAPADIRLIALRHAHHARASGYDRLADYLPAIAIPPVRNWSLSNRLIARLGRPLIRNSGLQWYHRDNFLSEVRAARSWFAPGDRVYHFLYGENSYRYLGALKATGRRHPIVCTFHTPASRFAEVVRTRKHLDHLDACVALTTEMRDYFADLVGPDRAFHIPHGVDTEHFTPAGTAGDHVERPECLAVGSHLRDFEALSTAAESLAERAPHVRFTVVSGKQEPGLSRLGALRNTTVLHNVPDAELLAMYRRASLFILPVREVTANNALLEALACGLPVVATDLPGVRDHVTASCARLVQPGSGEALADSILEALEDPRERDRMGAAARARALELDWRRIAGQMLDLYADIGGR